MEDTREGYLLEGFHGISQATPSGDFVIKSVLARPIYHGEIGNSSLRGIAIIDNAKHFLHNVDAVTSDFFMMPYICLKEQQAEVSVGGPFLRTRAHVGEG